ncbi:MAG: hypothetical protein KJO59_00115, partial [Ignavibacteria bacterium]|nr:hypothetical protein [Ignavibacteria bacterium]
DLLWDYVKYYGGDSVKFNYTLNQDIFLDSIIVDRPVDSSGSYTRNIYFYNKQLLDWKDQSGNLLKYYLPPSSNEIQYFPVIEDWDYWLAVYGQKAYGAKTDFYVLTSIKF